MPDATVNHGRDTTPLARCTRIAPVTMRSFAPRTRPSPPARHVDASWRPMLAPRSPSTSDPTSDPTESRLLSEVTATPALFARVSRAYGCDRRGSGGYRNGPGPVSSPIRRFLRFGWSEGFGSTALGAGGREFKSPHPDHLTWSDRCISGFRTCQIRTLRAYCARERLWHLEIVAPAQTAGVPRPADQLSQLLSMGAQHDEANGSARSPGPPWPQRPTPEPPGHIPSTRTRRRCRNAGRNIRRPPERHAPLTL